MVIGAVLVGGASRRMGEDKSLVPVGGAALGQRAVRALVDAGVDDVMLVGGTAEHAAALGGRAVADLWPGEGPVGGVLTALHEAFLAGAAEVVCLACDLPAVTGDALAPLLHTRTDAPAVIVVTVDGRPAPPNGRWPVALLPRLEDTFGEGADSFAALLTGIATVEVDGGGAFADADHPEDLDDFR